MGEWGILYKEVVQSVMLYGRESWGMTWSMLKVLDVFYHQVARRMMGITAQCTTSGEWECPLVDEALETSGIWTIKEYIQ